MDISVIFENFELPVVAGCLFVGYVVKKWIPDVDNKWIPTIVAILGIVLNCAVSGLSVETAVYGMGAGLASTGLHQAFKQLADNWGKTNNG